MASCEASGPCGSVCTAPSTVATLVYGWKFWIAPCETNSNAPTTESGNRTYTVERTKSTQKLPSVCAEWRANPRTSASATQIPVAADQKLCVAPAVRSEEDTPG